MEPETKKAGTFLGEGDGKESRRDTPSYLQLLADTCDLGGGLTSFSAA